MEHKKDDVTTVDGVRDFLKNDVFSLFKSFVSVFGHPLDLLFSAILSQKQQPHLHTYVQTISCLECPFHRLGGFMKTSK